VGRSNREGKEIGLGREGKEVGPGREREKEKGSRLEMKIFFFF
jgi:hypothetical protein